MFHFSDLIGKVAEALTREGLKLATAESCTGGLIGALCTARPGSSDWFCGGAITYSNELKQKLLSVPEEVLREYGAVSEQTVRFMAVGVLDLCLADVSVAVSGIAGPDGGTDLKPVGTVWLAWARRGPDAPIVKTKHLLLPGERDDVRLAAARAALEGVLEFTGE